jgi:sigma-B regulation protein RsbU (phosphoserine phosphatase)
MKSSRSWPVHLLLLLYILISGSYQIVAAVSLVVGFFDLRHQVHQPFEVDYKRPTITSVAEDAHKAGLRVDDTITSLNGEPYWGQALLQKVRWYARPGDTMRLGVRHVDGTHGTVALPLAAYPSSSTVYAAIFVMLVNGIVPLLCLGLGYWVVVARPLDLNAWLILILLSFPGSFISVSTYNCWPGVWLALRLAWHITVLLLVSAALLWFGLLFPERSRIDVRWPWLKWLALAVLSCDVAVALTIDYGAWYRLSLLSNVNAWNKIDKINDHVTNWTIVFCITLYWVAIFAKLRTASSPDARLRMRLLCLASVIGLGSMLVIFGLLPWFGIANPSGIQWLGYTAAILMLTFPVALSYIVIVQRAMDVRILLRMGTKYALARTTMAVVQLAVAALIFILFVIPVIAGRRRDSLGLMLALLAIAGLVAMFFARGFLGSRFQNWLDRRFFREAYNAELILNELAGQARTFIDSHSLIETVAQRISDVLHVPQIAVLLAQGGSFRVQQSLGLEVNGTLALSTAGSTIRHLTHTASPVVVDHKTPDRWLEEADEQEKHLLAETRAELLLPLPGRDRLLGLLTMGAKQSEEAYSPSDLRLLGSLGLQTGLGLEIAELARSLAQESTQRALIHREIEIAREVQERLFPQSIPALAGVSLAGSCRPALGVGGDYYDIFEMMESKVGLAIGDVSGKGVPAALLMASLRACLRTMTTFGEADLAQLMERLNQLVYESSAAHRYATFFFAVYDPSVGKLVYVNAGHNPPFLLRNGVAGAARCERLKAGGAVIGLLPHATYEEESLTLNRGDLLVLYTDGFSEAMTSDDEEWGEERMLAAVELVRSKPAEEVLSGLFEAADRFTQGAPQQDDMTLLTLKINAV